MRCPKGNVAAFISGVLSAELRREFDEHLLECEECWQALQEDRTGRAAALSLRSSAPDWLADRVTLMVEVASMQGETGNAPTRQQRRVLARSFRTGRGTSLVAYRRVALVVAAVCISIVGAGLGWTLTKSSPTDDPAQVAIVVAMAKADSGHGQTASKSMHLNAGGQSLLVKSMPFHGGVVLVATSPSPFPMPAASRVLTGSSTDAWMATQGKIAEYCVNQVAGKMSMLIVAEMPEAELPNVAAQLHLL